MSKLKNKLTKVAEEILSALEPLALKAHDLCEIVDAEAPNGGDDLYEAWDLKYALEETVATVGQLLEAIELLDSSPEA